MTLPSIWARNRAGLLARLLANGLSQAASAVARMLLLRHVFDLLIEVGQGRRLERVGEVGLALAGLALASGWLRRRERIDAELLGQGYVHSVRLALFDRLHSLTPRSAARLSRGGLLLRFVGDLSALRQWVSVGLSRALVAGATVSATAVALAVLDPVLAVATLNVLVAGTALAAYSTEPFREAVRRVRRRRAQLATTVSERLQALAVALAFGRVRSERRRISRRSRRLRDAMSERARRAGTLEGLSEATSALAVALVLVLGAQRVAAGHATPGTVVAALIATRMLISPLQRLGRALRLSQSARVARSKIGELLARPAELFDSRDAPALVRGPGRLELRALSGGCALRHLSAVVEPGSVVAIVGSNGSGKSLLLSLIAGLERPLSGQVLLDGQDLARVSSESRHRAIGMVSPDLPLLRGAVGHNLRYRCPDATAEELDEVVRSCGVDEILAGMPLGLATKVSEGASNLSVGQRSRIALARALLAQPTLLLLDEPDANLDAASRERLDRAVAAFSGTVLWVTHRPEAALSADLVWQLEDGRLVEISAGQRRASKIRPAASDSPLAPSVPTAAIAALAPIVSIASNVSMPPRAVKDPGAGG